MKPLVLDADQIEVHTGEAEYEVALPAGDCQLDYRVLGDGDVALYVSFGAKVVPVAYGPRVEGRLLVKDAKWLLIRPAKKSMIVGVQIFHSVRRIVDENNRKPVAVFVPQAPPMDLKAVVGRLLAERMPGTEKAPPMTAEELEELYPEDVDTEFGPGYTQLEEDEELIDALRTRKKAAEDRRKGEKERKAGKGGSEEEKPDDKQRRKEKKSGEENEE